MQTQTWTTGVTTIALLVLRTGELKIQFQIINSEKTWCGGVDCATGAGVYANARSRVCVGEGYSEESEVKVGVHQGSVLSPLLFIIVLEALS